VETLWLTIGTLCFAAATIYFLSLMGGAPGGSRHFFIIMAVITGVTAFFYLTMSTGATSSLVEGRIFYWGRYLEWVISTPLLLLILALLALASWRDNVGLIAGLMAIDVFVVLTGLQAGSSLTTFGKGFWFVLSTVALVALLYLIYTRLFAEAARRPAEVQSAFRTLAMLIIVVWSCYPVVWLLGGAGFGAATSTVEVFLILILDLLATVGFGFLLLKNHRALGEATGPVRTGRVR
jgi:bacteriorhodopsin